jgi:hypothetical protein
MTLYAISPLSFDPKYIDLTGVKAAQLAKKRQALSGSQQQIATNNAELQTLNS